LGLPVFTEIVFEGTEPRFNDFADRQHGGALRIVNGHKWFVGDIQSLDRFRHGMIPHLDMGTPGIQSGFFDASVFETVFNQLSIFHGINGCDEAVLLVVECQSN